MTIFAFVLFGANLLALVLVLASQRITAPMCGGCGGSLAPTTDCTCEQCGGNLLQIGVTAGAVMRPPGRGVLLVLMTVLVVSLTPLLVLLVEGEIERRERNGPGYFITGAKYGFSHDSPVTGKNISIKLLFEERLAPKSSKQVTWAGLELTRVPPSDAHGPPLTFVMSPDGKQDYSIPTRTAVRYWMKQEKIFLDSPEGEVALDRSVNHILSQMQGHGKQSYSTGFDMNSVVGQSSYGPIPTPRWIVRSYWIGMGIFEALLLLVGILLVVRFTRRSRTT